MRTKTVSIVVAIVLAGGCSSGSGISERHPDLRRAWDLIGVEPNEFESRIIADGIITDAEYRSAVDAAVECMVERGWNASASPREDELTFALTVDGSAKGMSEADLEAEQARMDLDADECTRGTTSPLEMAFMDSRVLTGEERERAFDEFVQCLDDVGIPIQEPASLISLSETELVESLSDFADYEQWAGCMAESPLLFSPLGE